MSYSFSSATCWNTVTEIGTNFLDTIMGTSILPLIRNCWKLDLPEISYGSTTSEQ